MQIANKVKTQFDKGVITDEGLLTVVKFLAITQFQPAYITDFGQPHPHSAILSVFFHFFRAEYDIALQYAYSRDMHNQVVKNELLSLNCSCNYNESVLRP